MDLFGAAGIDLGDDGRADRPGRSGIGRTLRVPLLNYKVVARAQNKFTFDFSAQQLEAAKIYAKTAGSTKFAKEKETAVRNLFYEKVLREILGYTHFDPERTYTLAFEHPIRRGTADVALGRFGGPGGADETIATHYADAFAPIGPNLKGKPTMSEAGSVINTPPRCSLP